MLSTSDMNRRKTRKKKSEMITTRDIHPLLLEKRRLEEERLAAETERQSGLDEEDE